MRPYEPLVSQAILRVEPIMSSAIEHFEPYFEEAAIDDAVRRLTQTRFPDAETVEDWQQGVPLSYCQELVRYWREEYNWQCGPLRLLEMWVDRRTQIQAGWE